MSRLKTKTEAAAPVPNVSGKFYTVCKDGHLLYSAFEITVVRGQVVSTKMLSRAPDMTPVAVGHVAAGVWSALRTQSTDTVFPDA